jgi:IclR family pca regulon transcriptional regulator
MSVGITVGTRFPAHATAMGRVLLASLPGVSLESYFAQHAVTPMTPNAVGTEKDLRTVLATVREQGWCLLDQELEMGLMSIAAPVRNADGQVVAAINVSLQAQGVNSQENPPAFLAHVREQLMRTAALVSADIGAGK